LPAAVSTAVRTVCGQQQKRISSLAGTPKNNARGDPFGQRRAILQWQSGQKIVLDSTPRQIVQPGHLTVNNNDGKTGL